MSLLETIEAWRQTEMARLGITREQHGKLIDVASALSTASGGETGYYDLVAVIEIDLIRSSERVENFYIDQPPGGKGAR